MQEKKRREFVKNSAKIVGLAMFANPLIIACDSSTKAKNQNSTKE